MRHDVFQLVQPLCLTWQNFCMVGDIPGMAELLALRDGGRSPKIK